MAGELPEIPANSHRSKEAGEASERPKVEVLTEGKIKKRSIGSKFMSVFFADSFDSVRHRVVQEVVFPSLRDLALDAWIAAGKYAMRGGGSPSSSRQRTRSYDDGEGRSRRYSRPSRSEPRESHGPRYSPTQRGRGGGSEGVIVPSREKADEVVDTMDEILKLDGYVTAGLLYELVGLESEATPQDYQWGWTNLRDVIVRQHRDGWLIDMPPEEAVR